MIRPHTLPPWLSHALRAQRAPVPWPAVVRGALAAGPLLLAGVLAGQASSGVLLALGAMLAGNIDRPGTRRAALTRLGGPALAGALGMVLGSCLAGSGWVIVGAFVVLGLIGGAVSAAGPVASAAVTQLLVTAAMSAGMPLPESGWQRAGLFLCGAAWLILLRLVLPSPVRGQRLGYLYDGERAAVAAVYDAVAALLQAAGGPDARARRVALTAALDQAQDALRGRPPGTRRLRAQLGAALPLAEAATALAWAGAPVPARAAEGPARLAAAVRSGAPVGPLPAPARTGAGLRALDDALLRAAEMFDRGSGAGSEIARRGSFRVGVRRMAGPAGREYGVRVGLSFGASAAVAQALQPVHWYWLPVTAVFLVKPDLGPLASRVLCRAAGTVAGALLFAGLAMLLPHPFGLVALVAVAGALIPVSLRHFAAQTAVITVLVLALVMVGGEPQASWSRIYETLLACALVLVAGHLPWPGGHHGGGVRMRIAVAREAARVYATHVLSEDAGIDRAGRWALRREAYRALAEASAAVELAAAELPVLARHSDGSRRVTAVLERLVDAATAYAVRVDENGGLSARDAARMRRLLAEAELAA
ncbi:FUSC family protein [Streptomyces sp. NPDC016845]|uniref:FUSC family protein n=1 Tax=Streptomyces sp. NPDC016845 TaxID=3364972 RepID=UPI00379EE723